MFRLWEASRSDHRCDHSESGASRRSNESPSFVACHPVAECSFTRSASSNSFSLVARTLVDISSHRPRSSSNRAGSARSSQSTRSVHRRPIRSRSAMIGRPVREPRTGVPGSGVVDFVLRVVIVLAGTAGPTARVRPARHWRYSRLRDTNPRAPGVRAALRR